MELPQGYNDKQSVAVWAKGGKYRLEPDHYMDIQEAFQPDVYQALSDGDVGKTTTRKRLQKSIHRTLSFLDECLERHQNSEVLKNAAIFGAIEGGYQIEERLKSAKETSSRPVQGFSIEGFQNFGPKTEDFEFDEIKDILQKTVSALSADRPRLMQGGWRPDHVLSAVSCGVDILDSSYPYIVTERGEAQVFDFKFSSSKSCHGISGEITEETKEKTYTGASFTIDLKDKRYREDSRPVLPSCQCYCCQTFARSYIHHLLNTSELLASVLLMIHNFHHYFEFFHTIRQAIDEDKFDDLVHLIKKQSPQAER
ncbi:queuine tRNA-ribosyltransferase accessory subunit 2-like [Liolophura sinensis]|uniref:queuine tRNA-ribosyltransferase accessory subunit 2-like n=1 Tax=Liolophura sinensis TaxID=3198878 RepID=UPI003158F451